MISSRREERLKSANSRLRAADLAAPGDTKVRTSLSSPPPSVNIATAESLAAAAEANMGTENVSKKELLYSDSLDALQHHVPHDNAWKRQGHETKTAQSEIHESKVPKEGVASSFKFRESVFSNAGRQVLYSQETGAADL